MWPITVRNSDGVGIKFKENFWITWGPTNMFYFNPNLFNDKKDIKSIYLLYLNQNEVNFDKEEIAMGLTYECGDFGDHIVLFSYVEKPKIITKCNSWNYYVLPKLEIDNDLVVNLYNNKELFNSGLINCEELYIRYLEDEIIDYNGDKETFRTFLNSYIKDSNKEQYKEILENINLKLSTPKYLINFRKDIRKCLEEKDSKEFNEIINKILDLKVSKEKTIDSVRENYKKTLELLEKIKVNNDLNSIFKNCRDLFIDDFYKSDIDSKTGDIIITSGSIINSENGLAVLKENKERKYILQ